MELKEIKKVIELMKNNELSEFEMEDQGFRISIKRRNGSESPLLVSASAPGPIMVATPAVPAAPAAPAAEAEPAEKIEKDEGEGWVDIKSPIVGTFYRASSPEVEPFVTVGQEIDEDTVVCIVEAMKVMNEIKAEVRGVIKKILVENATAIEFGQILFRVEPL